MAVAPGASDVRISRMVESAEEQVEGLFRTTKKYVPHVARLLLVATFIDDGIRMITYWNEQVAFFRTMYPYPVVVLILLVNCLLQLGCAAMVLGRRYSDYAVYGLFFVLVFQTVLYSLLWSANFMARNLALMGSLVLLMADSRTSGRRDYAGVPSMGNEDHVKAYMQLAGRLLLLLMFFTLVHPNMSAMRWAVTVLDFCLMLAVAVGYKAKLASFALVVVLFGFNFVMNNFWAVPSWQYDFVKYDFFQTLSVIGGLLMVVSLGAGDLSIDERKKNY
eukprot:comp23540_c0_seq1/m.39698 comp23540_c0_seq1/g.39698  ORF comp23540_c0_seq1/g.39698 comp23540_c0_seq1/m.39698 type:complete len:276 (-) comp23540_c0_seq1:464-1291(-)